jgi:hypothetical protein
MRLELQPDDLAPIVRAVVAEVTRQQAESDAKLGDGRIGYTEAEAAAALGLPAHRLRDCRLRGEITARRIGKSYVYSRDALRRFLESSA